ncbi:glycosyltransferase family 4 protein [Pseudothermotoga sp.]
MNLLVLTNLFPVERIPTSGVFITKRLQVYEKLGMSYTAAPVPSGDSSALTFLRLTVRKKPFRASESFLGVKYTSLRCCERNVRSFIISKLMKNGYVEISQRFAKCFQRSLDISQYDLIHAHGMYAIPAGLVARFIAENQKKPFVVTVHGCDVNQLMRSRRDVYIETFERASAVIFVSKALLEKAKSYGYSANNAHVVPNGFDPKIFRPLDKDVVRKELGVYREKCKYVGFVGSLDEVKRADKLIEIFSRVRDGFQKVTFIIVGNGHLRKRMEQEAKKEELDALFTGWVTQEGVAKYMNAMDVMILPSRREGFGAVVIEAQACGTCVIGSSNGGIPEAIGFDEYVVEEGEEFEDRIAHKVVQVLEKGYDREKLIERAKDFTWEKIVQTEKKIYEQVLGSVKREFQSNWSV